MRIRYYKKTVVLFSFASVLLTGCTTSFPDTPEYDLSPATPSIGNDEVRRSGVKEQVLVFVNNQNYDVGTRGTGPFETTDDKSYNTKLANSKFYIYAFRHGYYKQGNVPARFKVAANLQKYYLAESNKPSTSLFDANNDDCLVDGTNYEEGLEMSLNGNSSTDIVINGSTIKSNPLAPVVASAADKLYYNFAFPTLPYNFFGYYIDDINLASAVCHREANRIWYENFTISGTQDVLCGKAPLLTSSFFENNYKDKFNRLSKAERDTILNNGAYSSFTASCDIAPQIVLQHQLAYLKFIAVPCDPASDSIYITGIRVEGPTKGNFTVASVNADFPKLENYYPLGIEWDANSASPLALCEASVNNGQCLPLDTTKYGLKCTEKAIAFDKEHGGWISRASEGYEEYGTKRIGGALLLAPAKSYVINLDYKQVMGKDGAGKPIVRKYTSQYTISNNFVAGKAYTIQIGVFGVQHIEVGLGIESWKKGGDVSIDPDNADSEGY